MKNILVMCHGDNSRSRMAEGFLRYFAKDTAHIYAAGIEALGPNPHAVAVMHEEHIDIDTHKPVLIDELADISFDYIITLCDSARAPFFPSTAQKIHHHIPDPTHIQGSEPEIVEAYRQARTQIKTFCHDFVKGHLGE